MNLIVWLRNKFKSPDLERVQKRRRASQFRLSTIKEELQVAKTQAKVRRIGYAFESNGSDSAHP